MPFDFHQLEIPDVILVEAVKFTDDRGFFMESYKLSEFLAHNIPGPFVQDNLSYSVRNTLRGLHYQKRPHSQGKLVIVYIGEIFDVAVDIRKSSPTYGKWVAVHLSGNTGRMIYVPEGFAHGFCVLSDYALVGYKVTREYHPPSDRGIIWNDPEIAINWPIKDPILSSKDANLPTLSEADNNL